MDVISIVLMVPQIWAVINHFDTIPAGDTMSIVKIAGMLLLFLSLFISATGQFLFKKYGIITYYVQFPFRLVMFVYSVGFITFLPELFMLNNAWFVWMFRICVTAEFFRIYYTVQAHREYFR